MYAVIKTGGKQQRVDVPRVAVAHPAGVAEQHQPRHGAFD